MQTVRLKAICRSKVASEYDGHNIVLEPVIGGSEENKSFWNWTPSGRLEFSTINDKAAEMFVEGDEYYVDVSPSVPPGQPE